MQNNTGDYKLGYIDFLSNFLFGIIVLFVLSIQLLSVKKEDAGLNRQAEFIITADWDKNIDCDVDLWVRDGQGNVLSYRKREVGAMVLERDDKGIRDDVFKYADGTVVNNPDNKEVVTIRGIVPGEYTVNVHLFSCHGGATAFNPDDLMQRGPANLDTHVKIIRLNPQYVDVLEKTIHFNRIWEEYTIAIITVNREGQITNIDKTTETKVRGDSLP